jgi:hypothetical protein
MGSVAVVDEKAEVMRARMVMLEVVAVVGVVIMVMVIQEVS